MRTVSKQLRTLGSVGLAGALLCVGAGGAGASPQAGSSEAATGWAVYSEAPIDAALSQVQGRRNASGGCDFQVTQSLAPGEVSSSLDEVAYNHGTCQSRLARSTGRQPVANHPSDNAGASLTNPAAVPSKVGKNAPGLSSQGLEGSGATKDGLVEQGEPATAAAWVNSAGYYKSYFEDPVQIDVNSVKNSVNWNWNNYNCIRPGTGSYHYGWFSASGWTLRENNWQNAYGCNDQRSDSYVHYRNGRFCATIDTHTYYNRNKVQGWWTGRLTGAVSWSKNGGCTRLLSFHTDLRRTKN